MEVKYYDIGVNLFNKQYSNPEAITEQAAKENVVCILTGTGMAVNKKVDSFTKDHITTYGTAGIHPHNADKTRKEDFEKLEQMLRQNDKLVAVGECGLDYDRMFSTKENQIRCLEKHIVLAEKVRKPLFLHERMASSDFIKRFSKHREICKKSVVHCFTGDKDTLHTYLEMGFYIGITGWICDDRRGKELREAVKLIPLDRILVETDSPYLVPENVPNLSRINVPGNIKYVVKELSKYMGVEETTLTKCARENTKRFFNI